MVEISVQKADTRSSWARYFGWAYETVLREAAVRPWMARSEIVRVAAFLYRVVASTSIGWTRENGRSQLVHFQSHVPVGSCLVRLIWMTMACPWGCSKLANREPRNQRQVPARHGSIFFCLLTSQLQHKKQTISSRPTRSPVSGTEYDSPYF